MLPIRRRLRAAALILYGLASAGTAALAQDTNTIGPPQLKDFTLPGQRTTPPATPPPVATPPVTTTPPRTAPSMAPSAAPVRERPAPAPERREAPAPRREAPAANAPAPVAVPPQPVPATPVETAPAPPPQAAEPATAPADESGNGWLWPALGLVGLLLLGSAFLLLRRRRREAEAAQSRAAAREEIGGALLAGAAPVPEAETPRPWLDLDIAPDRAAATEAEAVVHYSLTLTNNGEAEAGNIRIDPRLFNAGAEGDIMAFFQGPIHEQSGSPHIRLAPGASLRLMGEVAMPKAELREIEIQGRRIFVPMVAINVAYDWAGGSGRTSKSWLVGREAETPSAKMGPFRLDLGPRIYRSVGRREGRLVRV